MRSTFLPGGPPAEGAPAAGGAPVGGVAPGAPAGGGGPDGVPVDDAVAPLGVTDDAAPAAPAVAPAATAAPAPAAAVAPAVVVAGGREGRGRLAMVVVGAADDRLPLEAAVVVVVVVDRVVEFVDDLGAGVGLDGGCCGLGGAPRLLAPLEADEEGELLALPPESDWPLPITLARAAIRPSDLPFVIPSAPPGTSPFACDDGPFWLTAPRAVKVSWDILSPSRTRWSSPLLCDPLPSDLSSTGSLRFFTLPLCFARRGRSLTAAVPKMTSLFILK